MITEIFRVRVLLEYYILTTKLTNERLMAFYKQRVHFGTDNEGRILFPIHVSETAASQIITEIWML